MAKHAAVALAANTPALLSQSGVNVVSATWEVVGGGFVYILATVGEIPPADWSAALIYYHGTGELNVALADLFPGIVGCNRIYAKSGMYAPTSVVISHA